MRVRCRRMRLRRGQHQVWLQLLQLSAALRPIAADMLVPDSVSAEFFHTEVGTGFVDLLIDGHRETWPIRHRRFRTWLRRRHYEATRNALSAGAIRSLLDLLEAHAQFDCPERTIHVRLAEHEGHIYLDFADRYWRAVEIGPEGWRVIEAPPVRFRRPPGLLALPVPQSGGSIEALASFLNLRNRDDFVLVVAWLLAAFRAGGPYPLLAISGEQGSAKTVLSKLLKALVDPNIAPARSLPREERDLVIAANNSHVLGFDNLSGLPHALSDAFCRLATGSSFGLRQLYTDADEVLFQAARPIVLNGIEDVISRPDLADRAIFLTLPPIEEHRRRPEQQFWQDFENARAHILGALLDAVAHGLRKVPGVQLARPPRMADFALWATACETAFWPTGTFARAYRANRKAATEDLIDADPVAARVCEIMASRGTWIGNASDLLRIGAGGGLSNGGSGWPRDPRALAGRLRRAQAFLRTLGISISFNREGRAGHRMIRLHRLVENSVSTVSSVGDRERGPTIEYPPADDADAKIAFHRG
jgi:hypothetical protein